MISRLLFSCLYSTAIIASDRYESCLSIRVTSSKKYKCIAENSAGSNLGPFCDVWVIKTGKTLFTVYYELTRIRNSNEFVIK